MTVPAIPCPRCGAECERVLRSSTVVYYECPDPGCAPESSSLREAVVDTLREVL